MTSTQLAFDQVEIRRAPGFEDGGFPVEGLCKGLNIVYGPNASGKTTLANCLQQILWPQQADPHASLAGRFEFDGEPWHVDVDHARTRYQRDGQRATAPDLPPPDHSDRYMLALHDLLQKETKNEAFAQEILRESAGGYDVPEASQSLGFRDRPSGAGINERGRASKALEALREARTESQVLLEKEQHLSTLDARLETCRQARRRAELVDHAIELAKARDDYEEAKVKLDALPDEVANLSGNEMETLEGIDEELSHWETNLDNAKSKEQRALQAKEDTGLDENDIQGDPVAELKADRDRLRELEGQLEELDRRIAEEHERREEAGARLGGAIEEDKLSEVEVADWAEVAEFADQAEQIEATRTAYDQLKRILQPEEDPPEDLEALREGTNALEDWLAETQRPRSPWLPWIAIVGVAGMAAFSGAILPTPLFLTVVVTTAGLFLLALYLTTRHETEDPRGPHRERFQRLSLDEPDDWSRDAVRERLTDLRRTLTQYEVTEQRRQAWRAQAGDVEELEAEQRRLEQKRGDLVERFGVAPDPHDVQLSTLAHHVNRWQDAQASIEAKRASREKARRQRQQKLDRINQTLASYGEENVETASEATAGIRTLEDRIQRFQQARRDVENARDAIETAQDQISTLEERRRSLFAQVGLEPGQRDRLRALCQRHDEHLDREQTVETARAVLEERRGRVEDHPAYEGEVDAMTVSELEEHHQELEREAGRFEKLLDEKKAIEADIEQAKDRYDIEEALAEKDRALDALEDRFQEDCERMVGHLLADEVQTEVIDATRPRVFDRAREILATITNGRYRLDLGEGDSTTFRAYDTVKGRGFALEALSSATRVQVLLAVRLAFVEQQETNVKLPLFFDETLANMDEEKAQAVIDSTIRLARQGRQVFYFTAQADEVAKWKHALDQADDIPHRLVDLNEIQDLEERLEVPDLDGLPVQTPDPPAPGDEDHRAYGKTLEVPPFDPRRGAGSAHLWYVVGDPDLLYHLLRLGIERWGQLENLIETGASHLVSDDAGTVERLQEDGEALARFVEAWKRGRGRRVDRSVLEQTDAITERFIDEVSELARRVDGDAERIVQALRNDAVDRFRTNKMDELEAFFEENGYIEPVDTLEPEQIRVRVIKGFVQSGVDREDAAARADALLERITDPPGGAST